MKVYIVMDYGLIKAVCKDKEQAEDMALKLCYDKYTEAVDIFHRVSYIRLDINIYVSEYEVS